jgi:hypothetical protein
MLELIGKDRHFEINKQGHLQEEPFFRSGFLFKDPHFYSSKRIHVFHEQNVQIFHSLSNCVT